VAQWRDDADAVPEQLCRFVMAEWAGEVDAPGAWGQACREWLAAHPGRGLPQNRDGDPVLLRQQVVEIKEDLLRRGLSWAGPPLRAGDDGGP
jgi:hypothetical protein